MNKKILAIFLIASLALGFLVVRVFDLPVFIRSKEDLGSTNTDKVMTDLSKVLTQARCVPNFEGGRPSGYRCFQIEPGSIYDKLGMKDNDVICGIDGKPLDDPAEAFQKLNALQTRKNIELCINRGGQVMNMQYDIN